MTTQLVPSLWSMANFPGVAGRMVEPATADASGTTLAEAESTELAEIFLMYKMRPGKVAAAGNVSVQLVVVKISEESEATTV